MHTISREALHEREVTLTALDAFDSPVNLSRSGLAALLDRARNLKQHQPGLTLPPAASGRAIEVQDPVIALRHPVHVLADLLTMSERAALPLERIAFCCTGDGSSAIVQSLMLAGTALGMDVRIAAPARHWPADAAVATAHQLAAASQAGLLITANNARGAEGAHFLVAAPYGQRAAVTTLTETAALAGRPPTLRPLSEEQEVNRLWVLDAVLADWLAAPGSTWSRAPKG
jgi:hypothetical protein